MGGGVNVNIPKKDEWGSNAVGGASSNWDPRGPSATGSGPMDLRTMDPRAPGAIDMRIMDREQMQGNMRGVTGRLNGATSEMWQQGGMPGMPGINKTVGPNAGAAGAAGNNPEWIQGPKDLNQLINKPSGWDSSPPAARRPIGAGGNFDDGTSLWGQNRGPGQDQMGRNNFGRNPIGGAAAPTGIPPNRLPGTGMKPGEGKICKHFF